MRVKLREVAHSRAGDKGDDSHLSLIVLEGRHFEAVRAQVTAARVRAWFGEMVADLYYRRPPEVSGPEPAGPRAGGAAAPAPEVPQ